jgi:phage terminase large subunit-like protein
LDAFEAGAPGVLFSAQRPTAEPAPEMGDAELRALLEQVYAGAPWVDLDRLLLELRDPGLPWSEVARFFLNWPSAGLLAAVNPQLWASQVLERELVESEQLALGFDGSHSQDGTALIGCGRDGFLFPLEIIERPPNAEGWRVDRSRIDRALEHAFATYDVAYLYADPWKWQDELAEWSARWPDKIVEFPTNMNTRMAPAVDRFRTALEEGRLRHDGDPDLTRHVLNARLRKVGRDEDGRGRYTLEKAGPGRPIDACVASVLAVEAAAQIMNLDKPDPVFMWT